MKISAKGTARIDGLEFEEQEISVIGEKDIPSIIIYGRNIDGIVKEEFQRLFKNPEDYYAVPEYPMPSSMKAAIVAIRTIWDANSIKTEGVTDDANDGVVGRVY